MTDLTVLKADLLSQVDAAPDLDAVEALRVQALGKQGEVTALLKTLGRMTAEERLVEGPKIHDLRESVTAAIPGKKEAPEAAALNARLASEEQDLTLPAPLEPHGSVQHVTSVMGELAENYAALGFSVASVQRMESSWQNYSP